jgi:DNA-binding transcriptional MocR family regulator
LREQLPHTVEFRKPDGGYFFWLKLPQGMDGMGLLETAVSHKVGFQPGVRFSSRGQLTNYIRLSFAFYHEAQLVEGARRLAAAMADYQQI